MKRLDLYKCMACGNIVEIYHGEGGELYCCGTEMVLMKAKTTDAGNEKHVPVVEKIDGGYKVKVGSVPHPMEDDHYIEWIELITETEAMSTFLKPGKPAEAVFKTDSKKVCVREHCNKHGLWEA
jgi:superoxide reductase